MDLTIRNFRRKDFPDYQSWFIDHKLNLEMGPMKKNDEWLEYVLSEKMELHMVYLVKMY